MELEQISLSPTGGLVSSEKKPLKPVRSSMPYLSNTQKKLTEPRTISTSLAKYQNASLKFMTKNMKRNS